MAVARVEEELSGPGLAAWRRFGRAHDVIYRELDTRLEREQGIQLKSLEVLLELAAAPARRLRMSELADAVSMSRSGLSRLIDRLVADGLIDRTPCADDARGSYAVLTALGRRRLRRVMPGYERAVRDSFLVHFSSDELERLREYCERALDGAAAQS